MLKDRQVEYERYQLTCDGYLKAHYVLKDSKTLIGVQD